MMIKKKYNVPGGCLDKNLFDENIFFNERKKITDNNFNFLIPFSPMYNSPTHRQDLFLLIKFEPKRKARTGPR